MQTLKEQKKTLASELKKMRAASAEEWIGQGLSKQETLGVRSINTKNSYWKRVKKLKSPDSFRDRGRFLFRIYQFIWIFFTSWLVLFICIVLFHFMISLSIFFTDHFRVIRYRYT